MISFAVGQGIAAETYDRTYGLWQPRLFAVAADVMAKSTGDVTVRAFRSHAESDAPRRGLQMKDLSVERGMIAGAWTPDGAGARRDSERASDARECGQQTASANPACRYRLRILGEGQRV